MRRCGTGTRSATVTWRASATAPRSRAEGARRPASHALIVVAPTPESTDSCRTLIPLRWRWRRSAAALAVSTPARPTTHLDPGPSPLTAIVSTRHSCPPTTHPAPHVQRPWGRCSPMLIKPRGEHTGMRGSGASQALRAPRLSAPDWGGCPPRRGGRAAPLIGGVIAAPVLIMPVVGIARGGVVAHPVPGPRVVRSCSSR